MQLSLPLKVAAHGCNSTTRDELPWLPKGFETIFTSTELMRPLLRKKPKSGVD
jgi:hypothetical protein